MKKKIENSNAVTAIYVRRSVADRDNNSLSIESQKEDCIKYIGEDCVYHIYCDMYPPKMIQFNLSPPGGVKGLRKFHPLDKI